MMKINFLQSQYDNHPSIWLSDVERSFITSSQVEQWITRGIVQGFVASYSSLERSLRYTQAYDRDFQAKHPDCDAASLYHYIVIHDIQLAADRLKQIHEQTQGWDGYVNLDLPPDSETIMAEAQNIWKAVGWSNLMLKIPATPALLPAIQHLIRQNVNVNATLVISHRVYAQVAEAYLAGLEALVLQGKKLNQVASVASVPLRCFDQAVRAIGLEQQERILPTLTQVRLVKQHYQAVYQGDRWQKLADQGAKPQRLLWDMAGISDPIEITRYIEGCDFPEAVIELSAKIWNVLYNDGFLQFNGGRNLQISELKASYFNLNDCLNLCLSSMLTQWMTEEVKQLNQSYAQVLNTIKQKQNRMI